VRDRSSPRDSLAMSPSRRAAGFRRCATCDSSESSREACVPRASAGASESPPHAPNAPRGEERDRLRAPQRATARGEAREATRRGHADRPGIVRSLVRWVAHPAACAGRVRSAGRGACPHLAPPRRLAPAGADRSLAGAGDGVIAATPPRTWRGRWRFPSDGARRATAVVRGLTLFRVRMAPPGGARLDPTRRTRRPP